MASSLTEVPTREIATDTNNHGLGPTKSNIAPVVDTAHELDAREEELIRDWVRRLARAVGVEGTEDEYWFGDLPTTSGVGSLLHVVGRWLGRGHEARAMDHFIDGSLSAFWSATGGVSLSTTTPGGAVGIARGTSAEAIEGVSAWCDHQSESEVDAVVIPTWTPAPDDGSTFGIMLSEELTSGPPMSYAQLRWNGASGVNAWQVRIVIGGVEQELKSVNGTAPQAGVPQRLRLRVSCDATGGTITARGYVGSAEAVAIATTSFSNPLRPIVYIAPTSPTGTAILVDYVATRSRISHLDGVAE